MDAGIHREQYHFRLDGSQMEKIFSGPAPLGNNGELITLKEPRQSFPIPTAPERVEEFAPGPDPELQELADAFSDFKEKLTKQRSETNGKKTKK